MATTPRAKKVPATLEVDKQKLVFTALKNGFFGIKLGDEFQYDIHGVLRRLGDKMEVNIAPEEEAEFFRATVPVVGPWAIGKRVMVKENDNGYYVSSEYPYKQIGTWATAVVSAWQDFPVVAYVEHGKVVCAILQRGNGEQLIRIPVKRLVQTEAYYFISSSGQVHSAQLSKEIAADKWRKAIGNYFETKELATAYKDAMLNA